MPDCEMTAEEKLKCICAIVKCICDDCGHDPCDCFKPANGEVRLHGLANPIEIHNDGTPIKLPPAAEFSTIESGLELLFDDGGRVWRLRYLGDDPIVAHVTATVSM